MRTLWSQWAHIQRALARGKAIFLFDFDGTLAPIVSDPSRARLPKTARTALERLTHSSRVTLGIVSGRKMTELRSLVGLKDIYYVGSHGLEWMSPGGRRQLRVTPSQRRQIQRMANHLRKTLHGLPGILIERKIASIAVHFRKASLRDARMAIAEVRQAAQQHIPPLKLLSGKKVVEVLPAGTDSKGTTIKPLLSRLRCRRSLLAAYFGDDVTDESVFRCLGKNDLAVLVGKPRQTRARFYLRSPGQVCKFLERLCEVAI